MPKVCIDPGHQKNPNFDLEPISPDGLNNKAKVAIGSRGIISQKPEYEINLDISLFLEYMLTKAGINALLTRNINEVDISNKERAIISNISNADLCVKIHCNGVWPYLKWLFFWRKGIEVLVPSKNRWTGDIFEKSLLAGKLIYRELLISTNRNGRGIFTRNDITGFNWSKIPVVLVESGYLTNPEEDRLLNTENYKIEIANGIFKAILVFLGGGSN